MSTISGEPQGGYVRVGTVDSINAKYCTVLQKADGYEYERKEEAPLLHVLIEGFPGREDLDDEQR